MKRKVLVIALIMVALASLLVACNSSTNYDGMTEVVYELEGGTYKNCELPIHQYYDFKEGTTNLIFDPQKLSRTDVLKDGYKFIGWFKTKTVDGTKVTYSDEWDFKKDRVGTNGVTLYAKWELVVKYAYRLCYIDENGEKQYILDDNDLPCEYSVKPGDVFDDFMKYGDLRFGYTALVGEKDGIRNQGYYLDKEFTEPVEGTVHPGGEEDTIIDVYPKYIKGIYSLVRTASELLDALESNIYLLNDIDMGGEELAFGNYTRTLLGNGHTISNFKVKYPALRNSLKFDYEDNVDKAAVYVGIFGGLNGATIKDVTFTGGKLVIDKGAIDFIKKIYIAPLAVIVEESTIENVKIDFEYTIVLLPNNKDFNFEEDFVIYDKTGYKQADSETKISGFSSTITESEK